MNSELNWNNFIDLYDWEFDFMCDEQKHDVEFYLNRLSIYGNPVLEFGAGTGRITKELLKHNYYVNVVDNADLFLDKLRSNCEGYPSLNIFVSDMLEFKSDQLYNSIIVSYSTFQYLLTKEKQIKMMKNLASLVTDNGAVLVDISPFTALGSPMPDYYPFYMHYHPILDADITMFTSYSIDQKEKIQYWNDKYLIKYKKGSIKEFNHHLALRRIEIEEMMQLADLAQLRVKNIYGSFDLKEPSSDSSNWIFEIVKK